MSGLGMKYVASFINSFARKIKNMGDDITRTVTVMLGFMFVFALIFGGLSLRDLNSSWNHSVETREKLAECVDSGWHFMVDGQELVSLDEQTIETASGNYSIVYDETQQIVVMTTEPKIIRRRNYVPIIVPHV